jgi:hypothetical protein
MRSRPIGLIFLSLAYLSIALAMPLQVMWVYGHGFDELPSVFAKLTSLNFLVMAGLLYGAVLAWRVSPHLVYAVPAVIAIVLVNNFFVGWYATDFSPLICGLASGTFALVNLPLVRGRVRWLLHHPEQRWWLRAARLRVNVPVFIEGTRLNSLKAQSFDISESGVYVPLDDGVGVGDWITVRIKFDGLTNVRCHGKVVRKRSEPEGQYPAGVGIEFQDLSWQRKRVLRGCLARHIEPGVTP